MNNIILVIDDSFIVRQQVRAAFAGGPFSVLEAADGAQAIQVLDANADVKLVFCDVNMPGMGGIEFLTELEARHQTVARLPVVMLTTEGEPTLMQEAKALGARGWIMKPFKSEVLTATAEKLAK